MAPYGIDQHNLLKMLSFSVHISGFFIKNISYPSMCICYVSVFDSVPFTNVSVSVTIPWCFHYYSFVQLEFRNGEMSNSFFIIQDCFSYPGIFVFQHEVENDLSRSVKNCVLVRGLFIPCV